MQEANRVDALDGLQDLAAQAQGGADAEGPAGHAPPQVGQVSTLARRKTPRRSVPVPPVLALLACSLAFDPDLQLHHHVVKAVVAAAAHEAAHVVFT